MQIYDGRRYFYQWDMNQKLIVSEPGEVHFCNKTNDCSLVCKTYEEDGVILVNIPNILLQTANNIRAYLYIENNDEQCTIKSELFRVVARSKPEDYVYTEVEVLNYSTLDERITALEQESDYTTLCSEDSVAGCKGYYIKSIDKTNCKIYLCSDEVVPVISTEDNTDTNFNISGYEVGDTFTVLSKVHYMDCGTIKAISNNVITYQRIEVSVFGGTAYFDDDKNPEEPYCFLVASKPTVGDVIITECAIAFGDTCKAVGHASAAFGRYNIASGAYSFAEGLNNYAGNRNAHVEGMYVKATGLYTHAEGNWTEASGYSSHVEGEASQATGDISHAEGSNTVASGIWSHSEGKETISGSDATHAEGGQTRATASYAHAEGYTSEASGQTSHAEGAGSKASGYASHAEGYHAEARGGCSHAEGYEVVASSDCSHAEGKDTTASGKYSHAEGFTSQAKGEASHAEGANSTASGAYSHAEGTETLASSDASHAEGLRTKAIGKYSHAEGVTSEAHGEGTHAEGASNASGYVAHSEGTSNASGHYSHAEGGSTKASGYYSHAEGWGSIASSDASHAEGRNNVASAAYTHAEGVGNIANGYASHVEGQASSANGDTSHAEGLGTKASGNYSHAQGKYNIEDTENKYAHIVGNGTSQNRSNAHTLDWQGNAWYQCSVTSNGADYAEYFEWLDGNPNEEDRVGLLVTLDGDKIKLANNEDDILGIISGTAAVLGDNYECEWHGKYLMDEFGRTQYEMVEEFAEIPHIEIDEEGTVIETIEKKSLGFFKHPKLNPNYDQEQEYVNRADRPEWATVGMLGKLYVRDDGTAMVNGYITVGENGIATASSNKTNMRVLSRVNDNVIRVLLK